MATRLPLLSFSGGVDSTLNVISYFRDEVPFATVYVKLPNNEKQQKNELKARKRILKALTAIYGNYHVKDIEIDFVGTLKARGKFVQPYVWATSICYNIDMTKYHRLVFGYIKADDFRHVKPEFETLIRTSHKLLIADGNIPDLNYPLEWHNKVDVIKAYYSNHTDSADIKSILDMTYYCEEGKVKPCGKCIKCEAFDAAVKAAK